MKVGRSVWSGVSLLSFVLVVGALACGGGSPTPDGGTGGGSGGGAAGGGTGGGAMGGGSGGGGGGAMGGGSGGGGGATTGPGNSLGCVLPGGNWGVSHPAGTATISVQLQGDAGTLTVDRTGGTLPPAHIDGTFTYDVASGHLTMTNTAVTTTDPNFDACIGVVGTYSIDFPDCTQFALTLVDDTCTLRTAWADGATLTKQ